MEKVLKAIGLDRIGEYKLMRRLHGGMASDSFVYADNHGKQVIAKMLISPRHEDELEMFRQEVQALRHINMENVNAFVPLLISDGVIQHDSHSIYYYLMEYFSGETLGAYIENHELPWRWQDALLMLHRITTALSYSSQMHVHRDLHFGNIFLVNDSIDEQADFAERNFIYEDPGIRILDFGCAKHMLLDAGGAWKGNQFRHPGAVSTWSPELINNPQNVTQKHDSWALGVMLFRLLSNDYPVKGHSFGEIIDCYRDGDLNWDLINRLKIPYAVEALLRNLLSFDPEARFATGAIMDMCADVLYGELLDIPRESVDLYVRCDSEISACARCGKIILGKKYEHRCHRCGILLTESNMISTLGKRSLARGKEVSLL